MPKDFARFSHKMNSKFDYVFIKFQLLAEKGLLEHSFPFVLAKWTKFKPTFERPNKKFGDKL